MINDPLTATSPSHHATGPDPAVPAEILVDLWLYPVSATRLSAADLDLLNDDEKARAAAYRRAEDRIRYEVSHVVLRRALAQYVDTAPEELRFTQLPCPSCGRLDRGRPALADGGPHFSLSHSGDLVGIAVSQVQVGLDVERDQNHCMCEMARYMHTDDQTRVTPLPEPERHEAVLRWWVRTEAVLKCRGDGIGHGLGTFAVLESSGDAGSRLVCARPDDRYALRQLSVPAGFQAAVAVAAHRDNAKVVVRNRS
jgi:4'-phosphopantetheinyl transferase